MSRRPSNPAEEFLRMAFNTGTRFAQNSGSGASQGGRGARRLLFAGVAIGAGAWMLAKAIFVVPAGHRAVLFNRFPGYGGVNLNFTYGEGLNFCVPYFQVPTTYSTRIQYEDVTATTATKDLQMLRISLRVFANVNPERLPYLHETLGPEWSARVLPSLVNEVMKSVVAQFTSSTLNAEREDVGALIKKRLMDRAEQFDIVIDGVSIKNIEFSPDYRAAVEAKQVAQQEAERAKFIVERAQQTKLETIVRAEGEARSAQLLSDAIANSVNYLELRKIAAARDVAEIVAASKNKVYLNSENLMINIISMLGAEKRLAASSSTAPPAKR